MSAQGLPAHILALFTSRPPTEDYRVVPRRKPQKLTGLSSYIAAFEDTDPPIRPRYITPRERKIRKIKDKQDRHRHYLQKEIESFNPQKELNKDDYGDPFKTLFVARLSYDTTEKKLKREFESWGAIKRVKLVTCSKSGKPRGYAFIEYEHERDLKNAYKQADGKRIDGRRVMVDVERGRTVPNWLPIRLGGGRGGRKAAAPKKGAVMDHGRKDRDRAKDRSRDRDRDKDKDKDKEKEKKRSKDREKEKDRKEEKEKDREKDKEKDRDRDRRKEEKKDDRDRDRDRDREKKDRDRDHDDEDRDRKRRRFEDEVRKDDTIKDEPVKEEPA